MKKAILTLTFTALVFAACGQVTRDNNGNFVQAAKTVQSHDSLTTFTFTDKNGKTEPVFVGKKGGYYVPRISKRNGGYYRRYLSTETKKK